LRSCLNNCRVIQPSPVPPAEAAPTRIAAASLRELPPRHRATVVAVTGDDPLAQRLLACGLWPGAVVERIGSAPFGDPLLFRVQGYRLALRRDEAARVQVAVAPRLEARP
jgi:Fe2+ transport system protein FeoA